MPQDPNHSSILFFLLKDPGLISTKNRFYQTREISKLELEIGEISNVGHCKPAGKPKLLQNWQITFKSDVQQAQWTALCTADSVKTEPSGKKKQQGEKKQRVSQRG